MHFNVLQSRHPCHPYLLSISLLGLASAEMQGLGRRISAPKARPAWLSRPYLWLLGLARLKYKDQAGIDSCLPLYKRGGSALEEILIRVFVAELKAGDQVTRDLALDSAGELLHVLSRSGDKRVGNAGSETVMVIEVFVAPRDGDLGAYSVFHVSGDASVVSGMSAEDTFVAVVIDVGHEGELWSGIVGDHRIRQVIPRPVVSGSEAVERASEIGFSNAELLGCIPRDGESSGFAGVSGNDIVPSVHRVTSDGPLIVERVLGASTHVVVGNCITEEQAAGVIPGLVGLEDFRTGRSYKLTDIELESLANRNEV